MRSSSSNRRFRLVDLALIATVLIWAVNYSVVKASIVPIPPLAFNTFRLIGSSIILLATLTHRGSSPSFTRGEMGRLFLIGIVGHTVYQILFILGMSRTTASNSALILGMTPVVVGVLGLVLAVEKVSPRVWAGVGMSAMGVYLLMGSSEASGGSVRGDLLVLVATLCWSVYTVLSKPLVDRRGPLAVTTLSMSIGTVFFLPFGLPAALRVHYAEVPWWAWVGTAYSLTFGLAIAYLFWYYGVSKVGPTRTAAYSNLTPVAALPVSWFALGEHIQPKQLIGAGIILLGIYLVRRSRVADSSRS